VTVAVRTTVKNVGQDLALKWNVCKCHIWEEFLQSARVL